MATDRVKEILDWYRSENPGVLTNLARVLNHGRLGGTGKLVILPVDQGFEHGPARTYAPNPPTYNPHYHFQLAIDAGCNAFAAPLGMLEAGASEYAGDIPLILKLNNHDLLHAETNPMGAQTASVQDALRLGCVGVGYTIYPGTVDRRFIYEQLRELTQEAKAAGLFVVVWSYARGGEISKPGETAVDIVAYCAQIAAQLGASLIKVKPPTAHIELEAAKKVYESEGVPLETLADRISHVVQSAFDGRRLVIFSGGSKKDSEDEFLDDIRSIRDGGGFGSIIGRNSFQREKSISLQFLDKVMSIYEGKI